MFTLKTDLLTVLHVHCLFQLQPMLSKRPCSSHRLPSICALSQYNTWQPTTD